MRTRHLPLAATILAALALAPAAEAQTRVWTTNADFDTGTFGNAVDTNPANQVVLGPTAVSKTSFVWSTNYLYGYTVRLDSISGKQTGRYDSSLQFLNGVATGAPPPNEYCNFSSTGNCPGRVAVDTNGDVWIVNRAFGKQGSVTKFSGDRSRCIDRNNNGVIDTSFDANADGQISVVAGAGEYFGQNDECILSTIKVGPTNVWPRGVAIDKRGKVWVSTFSDGKLYRYNPNEPVALEATVTVGGNPYSLATFGDYVFVSSSSSGATKRVHITNLTVQTLACPSTYGVVGASNDVAWLGGYGGGNGVYRADFANNTCTNFNTSSTVTAVTLDLAGNVWAAGYNTHTIHKISPAGVVLGTYPAGGTNPHGMSIDFQGNLWVVVHGPTPAMVKVNVNTGAIIGTYPIGGPGVPNADPYLYSDFTGVQIDRQAPYARVGTWAAIHDGGAAKIPWQKLSWNAEPQGAVPAESSLTLNVRAADSVAGLAAVAYAPATNGAALAGIVGRYVQVQAALAGPGFATPSLADVTVAGPCGSTPDETCCVTDAECADASACTTDRCPVAGGACTHTAVAGCCLIDSNCDDSNLCTKDSCPAAGGSCTFAPRADCCMANADCSDGDPCTADVCSGPGGTCAHSTIAGCCNTNADCKAASVCVTSTCPSPGSLCQTTPKTGCCTSDKDCADADLCTKDSCDVATGACSNTAVAGCCNRDGDCDDGKPCTQDKCTGPGGACTVSPIAGCCLVDADCKDAKACTTERCSGAGGVCVLETKADCCDVAGDCEDGDACTDDSCAAPGGSCTHTKRAACCRTSAECDDGDRCTRDSCPTAGAACGHEKLAGCCTTTADCQSGTCESGFCVPTVDAGVDGGNDATVETDAGVVSAPGEVAGGACGCEVPGGERAPRTGLGVAGLAVALAIATRRRRADGRARR